MLPDRVSNPGPLTYESGALPIALRGAAQCFIVTYTCISFKFDEIRFGGYLVIANYMDFKSIQGL